MQSNMSIYYIIGTKQNEYFTVSNSLILNSISNSFYDNKHFHILAIGQKKDYMLFQQANNKFYYQLGNTKNVFYEISSDQFIHFHLFSSIDHLFDVLITKINKDTSHRILIILQDHGAPYSFKKYNYIFLLDGLSTINSAKDIFIYNESCYSGGLVELFEKNNAIFNYLQKEGKNDLNISSLYYYSILQNFMYFDFGESFTIFLQEASKFISNISHESFDFFISNEFTELNDKILNSIQKNYTKKRTKDFFLIPIEQLKKRLPFTPKITKKRKLLSYNVKSLAHLYITNYLVRIVKKITRINKANLKEFFNNENYETFAEINKQVFNIPLSDQVIDVQKSDKMEKSLYYIWSFYKEYFITNKKFFNFKPRIEIVTSTDINQLSSCYTTIRINRITKIFPNSPSFAFFIRNAFFKLNEKFNFDDFYKSIHGDETKKEILYYPIFTYINNEKHSKSRCLINQNPKQSIHPDQNNYQFNFLPSNSLFGKIAAIRFITKFVRDYFVKIQNMEFPTLDFSCFFSGIPSNLLINFISFSILPNSDDFSNLKLNNENFSNVLKFSNLIFSLSKDKFRFITLYSIILSSEIKFLIAKNLIKIILNQPQEKNDNFINLFSADELNYTKDFIKSNGLNISDNSIKSIQLFLTNLFSENYIDQYNSITPEKYERSEGLNRIRNLEKSSGFNLQKMFLDLESSILNIIPSDVFIYIAIYSYLILMNRSQINTNPQIQITTQIDEMQKLFQIFVSNSLNEDVKQQIDGFNNHSLMDILQFCNQYISIRLQETFNFLQFFFQTYYFVSFFKVYDKYNVIPDNLSIFIEKLKDISNNTNFVEDFINKLKPFPLFCLPFILCLPNLDTDNFDELLSITHTKKEDNDSSIASLLLESADFYSKQFRIHLSNLSLYTKLKKYVLECIDLLAKISNDSSNDISNLSSLAFFKDDSLQYFSFEFGFEEEEETEEEKDDVKNNEKEERKEEEKKEEETEEEEEYIMNNDSKYSIEFFNEATNSNIMSLYLEFKKAISNYVNQFKKEVAKFLKPDLCDIARNSDEKEKEDQNEYNHFQMKLQFLLSTHERNHPYVQIVKNNFMKINQNLSISDNFEDNINIKYQLMEVIDHLAFSILEAKFNNKIEIEPIVKLIPEYAKKFNDKKYWNNPTNHELMALCSAIPFTLYPKDQFRENVIPKTKKLISKEEDDNDDYYSPPTSKSNSPLKSGNYRTVFENFREEPIEFGINYEDSINEALNLSTSIKKSLQKKYDASHKNWSKIIWDIFIDLFNTKLNEIHLKFDFNDKQLTRSWHLFDIENYEISKHFYALYNVPGIDEKDSLIYSFLSIHSKDETKIRSAYVYAFIACYVVLKDFTSFGCL